VSDVPSFGSVSDRIFWRCVAASAIGGIVIRVVNAATTPERRLVTDATFYHVQANLLAKGHGFADPYLWLTTGQLRPSAMHPPLYPLLLSVVSWFGGTGLFPHRVATGVFGVVTIVAIAMLARELAGNAVGVTAAVLAAVYPNLWGLEGSLLSESVATAFVAIALLLAVRMTKQPGTRRAVLLAIAIALAALTRPETILLLPLLALPVIATRPALDRGRKLALSGVVVLVVALVMAPWLVRNLTGFSRPVIFSTNGDQVIGVANCPSAYHDPSFLGYWSFLCNGHLSVTDDARRSALERERGLRYVRSNLDRFLGTVVWARLGRAADVYRPIGNARFSADEGRRFGVALAGLYAYWFCLPFALYGGIRLFRRNRADLLTLLTPVAVVFATAIYAYGSVRFRAIAEPTVIILAALGFAACWRRLRGAGSVAATR
jgi:4-amino-4-deoxy-L-arabinose transferase-like glycosyltransferase